MAQLLEKLLSQEDIFQIRIISTSSESVTGIVSSLLAGKRFVGDLCGDRKSCLTSLASPAQTNM